MQDKLGVRCKNLQEKLEQWRVRTKNAVDRKKIIYSCEWLLHLFSSIRRTAKQKRLMNQPHDDPVFYHTTLIVEERKYSSRSKLLASFFQVDLWLISVPNRWHPPASFSGMTIQRHETPKTFGTRGKMLLRRCEDYNISIDRKWEDFAILTSHTTMKKPSKGDLFLESLSTDRLFVDSPGPEKEFPLQNCGKSITDRLNNLRRIEWFNKNFPVKNRHLKSVIGLSSREMIDCHIDIFSLMDGRFSCNIFRNSNAQSNPKIYHHVESSNNFTDTDILRTKPFVDEETQISTNSITQIPEGTRPEISRTESSPNQKQDSAAIGVLNLSNDKTVATKDHENSKKSVSQYSKTQSSEKKTPKDRCEERLEIRHEKTSRKLPYQQETDGFDLAVGRPENKEQPVRRDIVRHAEDEISSPKRKDSLVTNEYNSDVSGCRDEDPEYGPEYFDDPCFDEDETEEPSTLLVAADIQQENDRGSLQDAPFELTEISQKAKVLKTPLNEKSLLQRFGLWAGEEILEEEPKLPPAKDILPNADSPNAEEQIHRTFHAEVDRPSSEERKKNMEVKPPFNLDETPGQQSVVSSVALQLRAPSVASSSPVDFPLSSPQFSDEYSLKGSVDSHEQPLSPVVEHQKSRKKSKTSRKKRKKSKDVEKDGKKKSKKEGKKRRLESRTTLGKSGKGGQKRSDDEESLETPRKIDLDYHAFHPLFIEESFGAPKKLDFDLATGGDEFDWDALDLSDWSSVQNEGANEAVETNNNSSSNTNSKDKTIESASPNTVKATEHVNKERESICLLCSENFLERYGAETIAQLANGHSNKIEGQKKPRIKFVDSQLLDIRGVDVELPNRGAIVVVSLAAIEGSGIDSVMRRLLDATISMAYKEIEVLICIDIPLQAKTSEGITRLQCALFRHQDFPRVPVAFNYTSLSSLPLKLLSISSRSAFMEQRAKEYPINNFDDILGDQRTARRLSFLLRLVPSLNVGGALALLQYALTERDVSSQTEASNDDPSAASFRYLLANVQKIDVWFRKDRRLLKVIGQIAATQLVYIGQANIFRRKADGNKDDVSSIE